MSSLRRWLSVLTLLLPLSARGAAQRLDIPAQSVPEAPRIFADHAKLPLLYKPAAISAVMSNALVGEYEARAAREQLWKGSGFEVVFTKANGATIRPAQSAAQTTEIAVLGDELTRVDSDDPEAADADAAGG